MRERDLLVHTHMDSKILLIVLICFRLSNAFYVDISEIDTGQYELLDGLSIEPEFRSKRQDSRDPFPLNLTIKLDQQDVVFQIDKKVDHSLGHILTLDPLKRLRKVKLTSEPDWRSYKQVNGDSFITCIKNGRQEFRLLGSVFNRATGEFSHNIIPVRRGRASFEHYLVPKSSRQSIDPISYKRTRQVADSKNVTILPASARQFYIETFLVADHSVYEYQRRFAKTNDIQIIFFNMKIYYFHFMNEVNKRFEITFAHDEHVRLDLRLTNLLFLTSIESSNWTNSYHVGIPAMLTYKNRAVVLTEPTLNAFKQFLNEIELSFDYDLAIGLFNKDLWSMSGSGVDERASVVGFSFESGICNENRYLIAEEVGGFFYVSVLTHEIGHNLGAYHDGDSANSISVECSPNDNYLMTPKIGTQSNNTNNQFRFSPCSVTLIKQTLLEDDFKTVAENGRCLLNKPIITDPALSSSNTFLYPGQIWSADHQCKMMHGENASFCHYLSGQMCSSLACRINEQETGCTFTYGNGAASGTVCASGRICLYGQCEQDDLAPEDDADCIFGDDVVVNQQVIADELPSSQMGCAQALAYLEKELGRSPDIYCQDPNFRKTCCKTCSIKCVDSSSRCQELASLCDTDALINKLPINYLCPRTCRKCVSVFINCTLDSTKCPNGTLCANGTWCQSNPCEPNPCIRGHKCVVTVENGLSFKCLPCHDPKEPGDFPTESCLVSVAHKLDRLDYFIYTLVLLVAFSLQ